MRHAKKTRTSSAQTQPPEGDILTRECLLVLVLVQFESIPTLPKLTVVLHPLIPPHPVNASRRFPGNTMAQNPPTSPASARDRLASLSSHIMGSSSPSVFTAANVAAAPEDPLFGLMKAFREDPSEKKVDLGIGAYRDNNAKPWILPVVKKVGNCLQPST